MRWLVPTSSATARSDRPPMPPRPKASTRASSSSRRRRSSGGRGIQGLAPAPALLAAGLEPVALELEVAPGETTQGETDQHAERTALVDALAYERAIGALGVDLVGGRRGGPERVLAPRPRPPRVHGGDLPDHNREPGLLDLEALSDGDTGTVEGGHRRHRRGPLGPPLGV